MNGYVLLLEDDPFLTDLVNLKCAAEQIEMKSVRSVDDAVLALDGGGVQLAILDVMLPKGCGVDAAAHIVTQKKDVPFIFISAKNRGIFMEEFAGQLAAMPDMKYAPYIMKPFNLNYLIKKIRETITAYRSYAERNRQVRPVRKLA